MYLPFSKLPRFPNLANFETFRKALSYLYSVINRLTSGKTYVDLFSPQSVITPIDIHDNMTIGSNLQYTSYDQIHVVPTKGTMVDIDSFIITLDSDHNYITGMPLRYDRTIGTEVSGINDNRVYWVKSTPTGTSLTLSKTYGGDSLEPVFTDNPKIFKASDYTISQFRIDSDYNITTLGTDAITYTADHRATDLSFNDVGTQMYLCYIHNNSVYQYSLSTAWDITSASYDSISFTDSDVIESFSGDLVFSADGTKFYVTHVLDNKIYQINLSTAWDLSTASYDGDFFTTTTQDGNPRSIAFKPDGSKVYLAGDANDTIYQYTLSPAWDITSATYDSKSLDCSSEVTSNMAYVRLSADGSTVLVQGAVAGSPIQYGWIYEYTLGTPWDLSTGSYSGRSKQESDFNDGFFKVSNIGFISTPHTLEAAYPMMQIEETFLSPNNITLGSPEEGVLAYGDIGDTNKSTLYYYDGAGFKLVKLGWGDGEGFYNNNGNNIQKYTGWCHGNGHYKVITSSNQIKIQFDYLQVIEDKTSAKDIVPGVRTNPISDYNTLILNTTAGLNSIDTGVITSSTGYYVYFVYNPTIDTYGAVLSLQSDKPSFPLDSTTGSYYNSYQRLGWIKTDASGSFLPSLQINDQFCFLEDPGVIATASFIGGTSAEIPLLSGNVSDNANYPLLTFLDSMDLMISTVGTGFNSHQVRAVSFDKVPVLEITPPIDTAGTLADNSNIGAYSDLNIRGTNIDFSIAHPEDVGGTDYSHISIQSNGFSFNKGSLQI